MEGKTIESVQRIESMTIALETLRRNEVINAPNSQRLTAEGTKRRVKRISTKDFQFREQVKGLDGYFTIKRIK